jgi:hypothetical protein
MVGPEARAFHGSPSNLGSSDHWVVSRVTVTPTRVQGTREPLSRLAQAVTILARSVLMSDPYGRSAGSTFSWISLFTSLTSLACEHDDASLSKR